MNVSMHESYGKKCNKKCSTIKAVFFIGKCCSKLRLPKPTGEKLPQFERPLSQMRVLRLRLTNTMLLKISENSVRLKTKLNVFLNKIECENSVAIKANL